MDANLPLTAASQAAFPWLSLIVLLPAAMALLMPLLPGDDSQQSPLPRNLAIGVLLVDLVLMLVVFSRHFDPSDSSLQLVDGEEKLLARSARIGSGMIVFDSNPVE